MNRVFRKAKQTEIVDIFNLYVTRVNWMNDREIRGWNTTNYLARYPMKYYAGKCRLGQLYVLCEDDTLIGAVVLLREDVHWVDKEACPAYYVHNLVTMPDTKGAGNEILQEVEKMARIEGLRFVRLDCSVHNHSLNHYYGARGYEPVGLCNDGPYDGRLREKAL